MLGLLKAFLSAYNAERQAEKAYRLLEKQEWSIDFMAALLAKSVKYSGHGIQLTLTSPSGQRLTMTAADPRVAEKEAEASILNQLDDITAVNEFIRRHSA